MMNKLAIAAACGIGLAILAVAIYASLSMGDEAIGTQGTIALTLGIIATTVLGVLLVGLMLYSHRHGYDDRTGQGPPDEPPPPP
jgi:hypothetical protein